MKIVAEIVTAIVLLASGAFFAPTLVSEFRVEALKKVDKGLSPLGRVTQELIKK